MRRFFILANCAVVAAAAVVLVPAFALADVPSSYTSYGYAAGVHGIAGSDAFPNFQNGAVNNRYPMAEVAQDASPSSTATATYSDSGPAAATAGSQYNQSCSGSGGTPPPPQMCENPNNSVPYAKATSPGPSHGHIDGCNGCGAGSHADADAGQLSATAAAYYAGGGTQPFNGASGQSMTVMDSGGTLTVTTHSEVDSFAVGSVKVSKITVDVTATSSLSGAGGDAHIAGGQVTANGQPVAVTDQGVTIQDHSVTCPTLPGGGLVPPVPVPSPPPAVPALPSLPPVGRGAPVAACGQAANLTYIQIFTVAPQKSVDQGHVTIWASGLHIKITHPSPGPGVPTQSAEYVLGEGFAELQVGSGGSAFGFGGFGGVGDFGGGDFGGFGSGDQAGAPGGLGGPNSAAGQIGTALAASRVPLAWMFLTLEALLLASAAAWVWSRNAPADRVPDEVLAP